MSKFLIFIAILAAMTGAYLIIWIRNAPPIPDSWRMIKPGMPYGEIARLVGPGLHQFHDCTREGVYSAIRGDWMTAQRGIHIEVTMNRMIEVDGHYEHVDKMENMTCQNVTIGKFNKLEILYKYPIVSRWLCLND